MTDEDDLIAALRNNFSGRANNGRIRNYLEWDQARYFAARNLLLDKGLVRKEHGGPGGKTVLVDQPEAMDGDFPANAEAPVDLPHNEYASEFALYRPMLMQIESVWVKEEAYDSWICRQTALAGRRDTGGKWTRPDLTVVAVQKFKFLRDPVFDVISFEVKPRQNISVEGIFEALAHRQFTTRAYVIFHIDEESFADIAEKNRIETIAEQNGIGIILASDPNDYDTWIEVLRARRCIPDPQDLNDFINRIFPSSDHDVIIKLAK